MEKKEGGGGRKGRRFRGSHVPITPTPMREICNNTDYSLRVMMLLEVQFGETGDNEDPLLKARKKSVVILAIRSATWTWASASLVVAVLFLSPEANTVCDDDVANDTVINSAQTAGVDDVTFMF